MNAENQESKPNQGAENGKNAGDNSKDKILPPDDKNIWIITAEVFGVFVFGILSNNCFSTDHKVWGIWFSLCSIASGVAVGATTCAKRYYSAKYVWCAYWSALFAITLWFGFWTYAVLHPKESDKPHFKLTLRMKGTQSVETQFTNGFLFFPEATVRNIDINGYLLIPIASDRSIPGLSFSLENDSSRVADDVFVVFSISEDCEFLSEGWLQVTKAEKDTPVDTRSIGLKLGTVLPETGSLLPTIRFTKWQHPNYTPSVMFDRIRARDVTATTLAFWLHFHTNLSKPLIVFSKFKDKPFVVTDPAISN